MQIIDAYDAIAKGAREQKRHSSPSDLSDLDRRAFVLLVLKPHRCAGR
jgi:hypothetical protein